MSAEGAVTVDHLWKRFRVDRGRRLLRDHLSRSYTRARGSTNEHTWRWVLRDIDFEVAPGESVGIIGANGAGKSTLLKCVSGLMFPYAGSVSTNGQVGALIEVAAGIHSELTGRENITTYGNLLGLGRKQVADRFDEIVDFAEIEDAIDRQVKFYSSGMKVRLGFAVAAFLEPAILIVDEVLAVGDQSFQQKCLERMRHVLQSGTTLLLVSHDLAAVGVSVSRGIWLADGAVQSEGAIEGVLSDYRSEIEARAEENARMQGGVRVTSVHVRGAEKPLPEVAEDCVVKLTVTAEQDHDVRMYLGVSEGAATPIFVVTQQTLVTEGETTFEILLEHVPLPPKRFFLWFGAWDTKTKDEVTPWQPVGPMFLSGRKRIPPVPKAIVRLSPVYVGARWSRVSERREMLRVATVHWQEARWIEPQLRFFERNLPEHRVYASLHGIDLDEFGPRFHRAEDLAGNHPEKLNALAEMIDAEAEPDDLLLFVDSDAFPIAPVDAGLLGGTPLAAVRRDENAGSPIPHPCFCLTTVGFWHDIRGDWRHGTYVWTSPTGDLATDVGGSLCATLEELDIGWRPLLRSNRRELHPVWFGVYDDVVYHHGAGSRAPRSYEDTFREREAIRAARDRAVVPAGVPVLGRLERSIRYRRQEKTAEQNLLAMEQEMHELSERVIEQILVDDEFYRQFTEASAGAP